MLEAYKAFIQDPTYDELYKWQIAKTVQDNWDLSAPDLAGMIDRSFAHKHQNLWSGQHYFPKAMLVEWAQRDKEDARSALRDLLHGQAPLADRMRAFEQRSMDHVRKARPSEQLNTYQGMRAMALWLGMVLPEQHYLYKASMVKSFCERTGRPPLPKPGDKYTVIDGYYRLCDAVRAQLLARPDIIAAHQTLRDAACHADTAHHLLVQDFIYFVGEHMKGEALEQTSRPPIGLVMVNITWSSRDWTGPSQDPSNHGFVKEGNTPMESWNFDLGNPRNPEGQVLGFVQHTAPPKLEGDNNLVIFHSAGKVVGFYGRGRFLKDKPRAADGNEYNIIADRSMAMVLQNKLEDIKAKGYLEDKQRMGQNGFIYLRDPATAIKMIDEAIALNPAQRAQLQALREWVGTGKSERMISTNGKGTSMHPLNTILYGPPGTGKTYHAITHAVAIIDGDDVEVVKRRPREQVRQRYQELVEARLVRTVTFHQSFSYEDFVEGIKPQTHVSKDGDEEVKLVTYEVQDGIFKLMCASARSGEHGSAAPGLDEATLAKANFYKVSLGQYNSPADDAIYAYCMEHNVMAVGYGGTVDVGRAKDEATIRRILEDAGMKDSESLRYSITVLRTMHLDMKEGDIVLVSAGNSLVRAIGRVSGGYVMDESAPIRFKQFRKVQWLVKDVEIPVEDLYPKSFVMGTLYSLDPNLVKKDYFRKAVASPVKRDGRYVLIIDEINRGNVASIFGELITLIEDDKREGGREAARVKLPYSKKDDFSVPSNLYLLGTMNTADRSVEALDTALRRRFSFVEMPSLPEVIEPANVAGVDLYALLTRINQRVERLLDKDHHIGHSYFMGLKDLEDLKRTFRNKVIPLLEEYFHGDARKVGAVLGKDFVEEVKNNVPFAREFELDDYEVKTIYRLTDVNAITDAQPFIRIYANA
jgi:hypothetical protein